MIEEHTESFIVRDATGQTLGYFYFEEEFGRRSAILQGNCDHRLLFKRDGSVANDPTRPLAAIFGATQQVKRADCPAARRGPTDALPR